MSFGSKCDCGTTFGRDHSNRLAAHSRSNGGYAMMFVVVVMVVCGSRGNNECRAGKCGGVSLGGKSNGRSASRGDHSNRFPAHSGDGSGESGGGGSDSVGLASERSCGSLVSKSDGTTSARSNDSGLGAIHSGHRCMNSVVMVVVMRMPKGTLNESYTKQKER
jgi:hypothetical protein